MLRRMYMKWFDKKNTNIKFSASIKVKRAGIKSSTIKVTGNYLYGLMKSESGVHRLVRYLPFDSGGRRHTSFASVWVYPAIEDDKHKNEEKDLGLILTVLVGLEDSTLIQIAQLELLTYQQKLLFNVKMKGHNIRIKKHVLKCLRARLYEHEIQKKDEENQKN